MFYSISNLSISKNGLSKNSIKEMLNPCAISITVDKVTVLFIQKNSGIVPGVMLKYLLKIFIKLIRNYEIYDIMHMKEI